MCGHKNPWQGNLCGGISRGILDLRRKNAPMLTKNAIDAAKPKENRTAFMTGTDFILRFLLPGENSGG